MTELEEQNGKGYLKETIHGMLRRCEGWDYSLPCIYMITLVLANRRSKVLGEVPKSARCELTELGRAVEECWEAIPQFYPQVQIICKLEVPQFFRGWRGAPAPSATFAMPLPDGEAKRCRPPE